MVEQFHFGNCPGLIRRVGTPQNQPIVSESPYAKIEASADLTVTVTNQSGTVTFPAPGATSSAQRFYRAVLR